MTGTKFVAVHYKGAAPAMQDVIAGHIQLMFVSVGTALPQAKGGQVKIIGIGAPKRLALLPDIPAIAETVPGYTAVSGLRCLAPPACRPTSSPINSEVRKTFADPSVQQGFLDKQYFKSIAGSPKELSQRLRTEEPKWRRLITNPISPWNERFAAACVAAKNGRNCGRFRACASIRPGALSCWGGEKPTIMFCDSVRLRGGPQNDLIARCL